MFRKARLGKAFDKEIAEFCSSLSFDKEIFRHDLLNSLAHAIMLYENKAIDEAHGRALICALLELWNKGCEALESKEAKAEDIHELVEICLKEAGEVLQTARSRNDQIACDLRMKAREELNVLEREILNLLSAILKLAERNKNKIFPSYTHLQVAQVTSFSHYILAHFDSVARCLERLNDSYDITNLCPLGAGAGATSTIKISRKLVSELLGFTGIIENSLDAISARDFMLFIAGDIAALCAEISRFAEELIIFSTQEFKLVELSDEHASVSSMMPQKKNPDVLELIRAKCSKAIANCFSLFLIMKALPYSYNRDFQEMNAVFFSALKDAREMLHVFSKVLKGIKVNEERAEEICKLGFANASDIAEALVKKGMSFRKAHEVVGKAIKEIVESDKSGDEIAELIIKHAEKENIKISKKELEDYLNIKKVAEMKRNLGAPNSDEIERMLGSRKKAIEEHAKQLEAREKKIMEAERKIIKRAYELLRQG